MLMVEARVSKRNDLNHCGFSELIRESDTHPSLRDHSSNPIQRSEQNVKFFAQLSYIFRPEIPR